MINFIRPFFRKGIVFQKECGEQATHAITLMGWGVEKGTEYWLIKNSFGKSWGEDGFLRVARNMNICNINDFVSYPVVN